MSLLDVVRGAVKIADDVTKSLQATVAFSRCTGTDAYGTLTYGASVSLRAIVEFKQQQIANADGIVVASRLTVLFLDIAALTAATAGTGVTLKDKIVLPNGETGPIINLGGFLDAGTGRPIATQAYI